ncbi:MAG: KH domain-containing protein [Candidatus Ancillula sp.]|jgi:predicted RNA-binding protein YlqC (UPF0109 family)|nr:KH domain-containing protein [Candidatus Ancillula sp.]
MLQEALEHCVRAIVSYPGDVHISTKKTTRGLLLQIRTNPEDVGKVIGRNGRTIQALRTLINTLSENGNIRVDVLDKFGR